MASSDTPSGIARIVRISVSPGGVPKQGVPSARVSSLGVEGDGHRDHRRDGGPDRALCLFSHERIAALRAEGHPIAPGSIGENLTIAGIDWAEVTPGTCLLLGPEVVAQVTDFTSPCANITESFRDRDHSRVSQLRHPGHSRVYARVLREGTITSGDPVRLVAPETARTLVPPR